MTSLSPTGCPRRPKLGSRAACDILSRTATNDWMPSGNCCQNCCQTVPPVVKRPSPNGESLTNSNSILGWWAGRESDPTAFATVLQISVDEFTYACAEPFDRNPLLARAVPVTDRDCLVG
jgi:hypothetical protein